MKIVQSRRQPTLVPATSATGASFNSGEQAVVCLICGACCQELTVAGNRLTHLPEELGQLNQLRNFQAAGNLLEKLPNSFTQLTNLEASR